MERSQILETMSELKLFGMKAAYDEIIAAAVKRQYEPQRIVGDLLSAEIAEKQARSIKYQMTTARLPLAKDLGDFNNLALPQLATAQAEKEATINDQSGGLDAALTETLSLLVDDGNAVVLTSAQFRRHFFFYVGPDSPPPDATVTLEVPAIKRGAFKVRNSTAQTLIVTVEGQSLAAPAIAAGEAALLSCDGNDVQPEGGGGAATLGDIADVDISGLQAGDMLRRNASNQWVVERTPFILSMFIPGTHGDGALMAQLVFDRDVAFADNLPGSEGYSQVTATAATVLDLQKNGVSIGTITFSDSGNTAAFALSGGATFAAGDRLAIINENPADATLADPSITLQGKRV